MDKARFVVLKIVLVLLLAALVYKLFDLQVIKGEQYLEASTTKLSTNLVEKAPRGEILDRYGIPMVTNKVAYALTLQKTDLTDEQFNEMLLKLVDILYEQNYPYYDPLPISYAPYRFEFSEGQTQENWLDGNKYKDKKLTKDMSAEQVMQVYEEIYHINSDYTPEQKRRIIGIRYEADLRGFSWNSPFILADDVDVNVVAGVKERQEEFPGVTLTNDYVREYPQDGMASHILGRTGKMNAKEYEEFKTKGYGYNTIVGKQGIEKYAEEYLRGKDGTKSSQQNLNGKVVQVVEETAPVPGNYVVLTIDSQLQQVAEESLERNIKSISAQGGKTEKDGGDANAGAAVVLDIKNGDVLVCASYPTYNLSEFNLRYQDMIEDDAKPLWNRAISGTYTPGSTFKPLTAIAGLESGAVTPREIIEDEGIYRFYSDYQPRCWIWTEQHTTHGKISISKAIEVSCNYFFYETGRRTGIDVLDTYAAKFGLGEYTGIQLPEEVKGNMASPEYKKKVVKNVTSQSWYGGDTIQAAIGQSYSSFTPIQLANYVATIANGGTRYKTNIIKSVRSSIDGSLVKEFEPKVEETIDLKPETLQAVKNGMQRVIDEGSASAIFTDYPVAIGGKTGTAQVGSKVSNNALFVAFAPFDDPEIAVAVAMEHGVRGKNASIVAKDIFDQYFELNKQDEPQETE